MEITVVFLANYLHFFVFLGGGLLAWQLPPEKRTSFILTALIALPLAFVLGEIAGLLFQNPRPFVELGVSPLVPHEANNGFPSTHALIAMTVAFTTFLYDRKIGWVLLGMAVLVGIGRVLALVHSPLDVAGSALIAISATGVAFLIVQKVQLDHTVSFQAQKKTYE